MELDQLIARINALARKAKRQGLTEAETAERDALRRDYLTRMRGAVQAQLEALRRAGGEGDRHVP